MSAAHHEETRATQQPFGKSYGGNAPENYERFFVPVIGGPAAAELIEVAALHAGERVLDVACGTGIVARLAAERVGPSGKVAGLDLNPGMLAVARSVARSATPLEWHEASADAMPLPDESFDVVLCGLSLQFMPDKAAVLREMRRVLVPGGRLALSVPGPTPPLFAAAEEALATHLGPPAAGFVRMVFSLHDEAELRRLIEGAGFREVRVRRTTKTLRLPPPKEFLWQYVQSTPISAFAAQAGDERLAALERDVVGRWQAFAADGGMELRQEVAIATARK